LSACIPRGAGKGRKRKENERRESGKHFHTKNRQKKIIVTNNSKQHAQSQPKNSGTSSFHAPTVEKTLTDCLKCATTDDEKKKKEPTSPVIAVHQTTQETTDA
jgi:hypothetical protein